MSSLGVRLLAVVALPPIIVAAVLVVAAAHLFHADKELYSYDLATQTVDLLARNLATRLESLQRRAASLQAVAPPFVAVNRPANKGPAVSRILKGPKNLLRVNYTSAAGPRSALLPARAFIDLARQGPARLMVINSKGQLVAHMQEQGAVARATELLRELRLFEPNVPRLGTREVVLSGEETLAAFARIEGGLAVVQHFPKQQITAAAMPLIRAAALISTITVLVMVLLTWLFSRRIVRPLRAMAEQAAAIGRGEFDVMITAEPGPAATGEVASLAESLRQMSSSLKQREQELERVQQRLLQSERLTAANRVVAAVSEEIAGPLDQSREAADKAHQAMRREGKVAPWLAALIVSLDRASSILEKLRHLEPAAGDDEVGLMDADLPVEDVLVSARPLLAKRNLTGWLETPEASHRIRARPQALKSALLDVLHFISEHAYEGTDITVRVAATEIDGSPAVAISFDFQSLPLSSAEQNQLLSPMDAVEQEGTLALAVASAALAEEGGQLKFEAKEGGNVIRAIFSERGPRKPAVAPPAQSEEVQESPLPDGLDEFRE